MAKQDLAAMSVSALLKLRDEIGAALSKRAGVLKKELASLGADYARVGRIALYGKKGAKSGRKVAPKYRDPTSKATWAGRGGMPGWMREALKAGKKREDFLIAKPAKKATNRKARRKTA
jgi:DNA-binding protein H-NS